MSFLDTVIKRAILDYLEDQVDDFKGWFAYGMRGLDPDELSLHELADIALKAMLNTIEHGEPPNV